MKREDIIKALAKLEYRILVSQKDDPVAIEGPK